MKIPNMPMVVKRPTPPRNPDLLAHWRHPWDAPTECGLGRGFVSTISVRNVQCLDCLAALGVEIDDRTDRQREDDLAGELWRRWTQ